MAHKWKLPFLFTNGLYDGTAKSGTSNTILYSRATDQKYFIHPGLRLCNMPRSGYLLVEKMPDVLFAPSGATLNVK
jgi:hypothetical protein